MKRFMTVIISLLLVLQMAACGNGTPTQPETTAEPVTTEAETTTEAEKTTEPETTEEAEPDPLEVYWDSEFAGMVLSQYTYGKDYESLYDSFGRDASIADVIEDPETGFAYLEVGDERYLLGLDFLSMAMVYNTEPAGGYATEEEVYAAWWRLYVQRWNYLLPEIPLYANDYYCVYNTKLSGVKEHPVTAVWSVLDALIEWTSKDGTITIGNTVKAKGNFRYASFGNEATNAADKDICQLVNGLETVSRTKDAGYVWNPTVVKEHSETLNDDGSMTYTITLCDDLKFSDGSQITAKDYLALPMVFFSPMSEAASGRQNDGNIFVGWNDYLAYTGPGSETGKKVFTGIRLLDELTFSLTVRKEYIPYFYDLAIISLQPYYAAMWLGEAEIRDDGEGCYLTDDFYAKDEEGNYTLAEKILYAATDTSGKAYAEYPYAGPYFVFSYDEEAGTVVLSKNAFFKGNYEGTQPSIGKITFRQLTAKQEMIELQDGKLDFAGGISGKTAIADAIDTAKKKSDLDTITYRRAGYGKLGFRCDFGPAQFTEVRQAIAYLLDRETLAKNYTGGYGGLVDGPYYDSAWMTSMAKEQGMTLNSYTASEEKALAVLEAGGWAYDKDGNPYTEGVRYKKVPAEVLDDYEDELKSLDGVYKITSVGDYYYMPLVINWFASTPSDFTDFLISYLDNRTGFEKCGFAFSGEQGSIETLQEEFYEQAVFGSYEGIPTYNAFVFSTKLDSAMYDYSFNLTIDPSWYKDCSCYFLIDRADIHWLKERTLPVQEEVPATEEESIESGEITESEAETIQG
ncbi:MAG: hypothetical protein IJK77_00180 [Lachnospiraceae bacterium]|nr:hypothetical protein [Lachnospiraceae bacterium]